MYLFINSIINNNEQSVKSYFILFYKLILYFFKLFINNLKFLGETITNL